jgi:hypothetical protein
MSHHHSGPDFGFPHGDARVDLTDLYAFPKPNEADESILIMNVHPSAFVNPPGSTTREPFAPEASHIRSRDPAQAPAIHPNFLSTESDRIVAVESVRLTRGEKAAAMIIEAAARPAVTQPLTAA